MFIVRASQVAQMVKNSPANVGDIRDMGSIPRLGRFPRMRTQQPTPVFFPGESHGLRWATVHGIIKNRAQLKQLSMYAQNIKYKRKMDIKTFYYYHYSTVVRIGVKFYQ